MMRKSRAGKADERVEGRESNRLREMNSSTVGYLCVRERERESEREKSEREILDST